MRSDNAYRKEAAALAGPATKLLAGVMEKYTASILEEIHDQLKVRDAEIDRLRKTLGTAVAWLRHEYGDAALKELLDMLGPIAPNERYTATTK